MEELNLAEQFIEEVLSGKKLVCQPVRLAVERHAKDLKRRKFPYYFDREEGTRALKFFAFLRHTKGEMAGKKFNLQPFQAFIIWSILGWREKKTKARRFKKAYIEIARKNGKTELADGFALFGAHFDREQGAEVYFAATKREQAKIGFDGAKEMAKYAKRDSAKINKLISIFQHSIYSTEQNSRIEALASDHNTLDGKNPHFAIVDEFHAHKTDEVLKVLETGMGARRQPLLFVITTAGFNRESPCYQLRNVCLDILKGRKTDESVFAMIFTLDDGDDWRDPAMWIKANPNLGQTPYFEYMENQFLKAKNEGFTAEVQFKTKNLNIWTNTESAWLKEEDWKKGNLPIDRDELRGRMCFGGLDLGSTRDLCALNLFFPPENDGEKIKILRWYWCPEEGARQRSIADCVDYMRWAKDGRITLTPGNVTDYNYIKKTIIDICTEYNVHSIAYDRFNASQLVIDLTDEGMRMEPFGQGFISMNAPTVAIERAVGNGDLIHEGDPVLEWMAGNVMIRRDPAGNIKIDKSDPTKKVDGMVALAMAFGQWLTYKNEFADYYGESDLAFI